MVLGQHRAEVLHALTHPFLLSEFADVHFRQIALNRLPHEMLTVLISGRSKRSSQNTTEANFDSMRPA
jgi:hypothetical protein